MARKFNGPIEGEYEGVVTAESFRGELEGTILEGSEMDVTVRGEGELMTSVGKETLHPDRETQIKGPVEGKIRGEIPAGTFKIAFKGVIRGEMRGTIEPL
ncbi:hypothetical protein PNP59_10390 [Halobacterium salinarum]|uniref:hypothetical protein n=1 Tax=Halobacterium salinarum TaxID=2242 RepID=UPI0025569ED6|nr:hypothetical protein [Halobacterium salinarum]MDL0131340.1 hypothetical protein [Halobacterium salinarum]